MLLFDGFPNQLQYVSKSTLILFISVTTLTNNHSRSAGFPSEFCSAAITLAIVGAENDGHEIDGHEIDGHENDGHENAGHVSGV